MKSTINKIHRLDAQRNDNTCNSLNVNVVAGLDKSRGYIAMSSLPSCSRYA